MISTVKKSSKYRTLNRTDKRISETFLCHLLQRLNYKTNGRVLHDLLVVEPLLWIRIRIRIRIILVTCICIWIRIRIHIKVMRIHNTV
jgi:hypothetical protein